jgi:flagellar hook-basal body complex protein FliE
MPTPIAAANAYSALAKLGQGNGLRPLLPQGDGPKGEASFTAMLKDALGSVVEAGRKSDAQAQALATGKANIVDVVTAVAETETAVSALVSVRDRVVQAYDDIMKMPI